MPSTPDIPSLRAKAEAGDAESQDWLGGLYYEGRGVSKDYAEALKWFRKSAEQGFGAGLYSMGVMYFYGLGVKQNYAEAYFWFLLADTAGYDIARAKADAAAAKLPGMERAYAEKLAARWKPTPRDMPEVATAPGEPPKEKPRPSKVERAFALIIMIAFVSVVILFALFGNEEDSRRAMMIIISFFSP
jgi:TPR repeat protein